MVLNMQDNKPIIIVGLGNPGAQYASTRHNVGFMAVDFLAGTDALWKKEKNALVVKLSATEVPCQFPSGSKAPQRERVNLECKQLERPPRPAATPPQEGNWLCNKTIIFVKPQTFMNLSGTAVLALMTFYKIPLENLIVIHDDMDLKLGDVREKVGGGSAGHNGIKSIDNAVGQEYKRIRIGIGRTPPVAFGDSPPASGVAQDPSDWVLGKFTDAEMVVINKAIEGLSV
jgi:PTH1 family peptidyl-tRNA hydrolase